MNPQTQLLNSRGLSLGAGCVWGFKSSQSEKLSLKILTCKLISTSSNIPVTLTSKRALGKNQSKGKWSKDRIPIMEPKEVTTTIT